MFPRLARPALAVLGVFVTLATAAYAGGQQSVAAPPAQQPPVFRAGVKLVRVDVTATGREDRPVADLQASDFEVTEDGVPQRVEQLQFIRLTGQRQAGDDTGLDIRGRDHGDAEAAREDIRLFAIFLDDYHVDKTPDVMIPLRRGLSDFVRRLWPTDLVAVMDPLMPLSALRFTRSQPELLRVIQSFQGRQGELFPVKSVVEEAQLASGNVRRVRAEVTLSALAALAVKLGGLREGRKTILFVSQGPPTFFGLRDANLQDRMQDIAEAANRGNVTIYGLDPRGLGMDNSHAGVRDTLFQLAAETGGRAIVNTNFLGGGLGRLLQETSAYYVLGYTPTRTDDDGKFHKISVKVKRPGVRVLARKGYWAPSTRETEAAAAAAATPLDPAVARALDVAARAEPAVRQAIVWAGASRGAEGQTLLTVAWEPAAGGQDPAASTLDVEVLPAVAGPPIVPMWTMPAPQAGRAALAAEPVALAPGPVRLRFVARTADGAVADDWTAPVTIPRYAPGALALSTPSAHRARSLAEWRAIQAEPRPQPSASWSFRRTDRVLVMTEAYAAPNDVPAFEAHVLTRGGHELTALPLPEAAAGRLRFELPVGSLGQGTYLLRVRAKAGGQSAEQLAAFRIVP